MPSQVYRGRCASLVKSLVHLFGQGVKACNGPFALALWLAVAFVNGQYWHVIPFARIPASASKLSKELLINISSELRQISKCELPYFRRHRTFRDRAIVACTQDVAAEISQRWHFHACRMSRCHVVGQRQAHRNWLCSECLLHVDVPVLCRNRLSIWRSVNSPFGTQARACNRSTNSPDLSPMSMSCGCIHVACEGVNVSTLVCHASSTYCASNATKPRTTRPGLEHLGDSHTRQANMRGPFLQLTVSALDEVPGCGRYLRL